MRVFVGLCVSFLGNFAVVRAAIIAGALLARSDRPLVAKDSTLETRGGARFTFYDTGLGACGINNNPGDFIVALNAPQWDGGSHCFETITITYGGKTTQAQIVDRCAGCPPDALDFSRGLFSYFSDLSAGVIYGDWHYGNAAPPPPPPPPPPPTTHTASPSIARMTSSTHSSTPSSTPLVSTVVSTFSSTVASSATAPPTPTGLNNLQVAVIGLGNLIVAGAHI